MLRTDYVPGSPDWLDLGTPDPQAARTFYGGVFGWTFQSAGPDAGGYGFFQLDGKDVAATGPLGEAGARPAWNLYFATPDADASAALIRDAGGTVRSGPLQVMEAGRMLQATDPGGAEFSLWEPGRVKGLGKVSELNTFFWAELHTAHRDLALVFYHSLFGWRHQQFSGAGMDYTVLSTADGPEEDAAFGGLAEIPDERDARWLPYFYVADTDATAESVRAHGGQLLMEPQDVPNVGRIGHLADPFGAGFAVITPQPMAAA